MAWCDVLLVAPSFIVFRGLLSLRFQGLLGFVDTVEICHIEIVLLLNRLLLRLLVDAVKVGHVEIILLLLGLALVVVTLIVLLLLLVIALVVVLLLVVALIVCHFLNENNY